MAETPITPPEGQKTSTGLEPNIAAFLCYLLYMGMWVTGLIFYLLEKENNYVRFHALQAILLNVFFYVLGFVFLILTFLLSPIPFLGGFLVYVVWYLVFWLGSLIIWILLMAKAYQGQMYKLPVIGDIAERNI